MPHFNIFIPPGNPGYRAIRGVNTGDPGIEQAVVSSPSGKREKTAKGKGVRRISLACDTAAEPVPRGSF